MSENVLLSYKKVSTLIPKIMNYKFGVGVRELFTSIFYDLDSQIFEFKIRRGGLLLPSIFNKSLPTELSTISIPYFI